MQYFEYKIISNKLFKKSLMNEEEFNRLGKMGWELVHVTTEETGVARAFFKRQV
ncbi:MAG: DUF4177 domain-containing protein [Flavobacteriaceae bacterium]